MLTVLPHCVSAVRDRRYLQQLANALQPEDGEVERFALQQAWAPYAPSIAQARVRGAGRTVNSPDVVLTLQCSPDRCVET
jgi:hypothetical protein